MNRAESLSIGGADSLDLPAGSRDALNCAIKKLLADARSAQKDLSKSMGDDRLLQACQSGKSFTQEFWNEHAVKLIDEVNDALSSLASPATWNSMVRDVWLGRRYRLKVLPMHVSS